MKKSCFVLSLFLLMKVISVSNAYAITPPEPEPVQINLGDGLVFQLTPPEFEEQGYPESGLYCSGELIYTFDEWELWSSSRAMYFSDDAMTFLVLTGWHKGVIRFYERGVMTNSHQVQHLLRRNHRVLD